MVNREMPMYVVRRIQEQLNRDGLAVKGAHVLVLGLAYKAGTGDVRESPSKLIIAELRRLGAEVWAVDPYVHPSVSDIGESLVELTEDVIRNSELVVILTDHADFDLGLVGRTARRVFDTRQCIRVGDRAVVERL